MMDSSKLKKVLNWLKNFKTKDENMDSLTKAVVEIVESVQQMRFKLEELKEQYERDKHEKQRDLQLQLKRMKNKLDSVERTVNKR